MKKISQKEIKSLRDKYVKDCQLKLIFSADLQASTSLKAYGQIDTEQPWVLAFEYFYQDFPKVLDHAYERRIPPPYDVLPFKATDRLRVFKFFGDEILFQVTLERHEQVVYHIHGAQAAIMEFNRRATDLNIRCKPAAWLAGFPVENSQVPYPCPHELTDCLVDYIGPSMDCGFRLARYASPRKFIVSFDLAEMILDALEKVPKLPRTLNFFYDGSEPITGVLNQSPYPIIWIETPDPIEQLEDRIKGIDRRPCEYVDLKEFLADFRAKHDIFRWFIKTDNDPKYKGPDGERVMRYKESEERRAAFRAKGKREWG